ncbi:thiamine pyrophosphate-binding protein [Pikeienuella sp. HZG-20]|uniref:thiamine pyrophosphate-binding protein n=1 Tax=Paludibacillus litoralis TaxID=3133267 RepID=UPI0030ECC164
MRDGAEPGAATASDVIATRLAEAGCRHAFGIPGGEVLALMGALGRAGLQITLVKHENAGGFMAEGAWRATGAPGVLFATIGPGVVNAATAIANAWQERVPLIVLTGSVPAAEALTYTHQVFDHVRFLEPISKAAIRVEAGAAAVAIDKALKIATSGRPGPVILDVPIDVQREAPAAYHRSRHAPDAPMAPAGDALETARSWLAEAERPLVVAGLDVLTQRAGGAVEAFCRRHQAPVIATYKAKGVMPEADPLALGGAGLSPVADGELLPLVEASDCVILAGYDPIEMRIGWRDAFGPAQRVIDIAAAPNTHYMHQAPLNFIGDVAASLAALSADVAPRATWPDGAPAAVKARLHALFRRDESWGPAAVVDETRRASPPGAVAAMDSGAHRIVASQVWESDHPGGVLQSTALCAMGVSVPLAIGRKLAEPGRAVVAFVGDAGLEMGLGELATARDLGLGLPVVVFVDGQLGLIELKQRGMGMEPLGVEFPGTDFTAVANAMGGVGVTVADRAALRAAVAAAYRRDTFTLISAMIGRNAYDGRI